MIYPLIDGSSVFLDAGGVYVYFILQVGDVFGRSVAYHVVNDDLE